MGKGLKCLMGSTKEGGVSISPRGKTRCTWIHSRNKNSAPTSSPDSSPRVLTPPRPTLLGQNHQAGCPQSSSLFQKCPSCPQWSSRLRALSICSKLSVMVVLQKGRSSNLLQHLKMLQHFTSTVTLDQRQDVKALLTSFQKWIWKLRGVTQLRNAPKHGY